MWSSVSWVSLPSGPRLAAWGRCQATLPQDGLSPRGSSTPSAPSIHIGMYIHMLHIYIYIYVFVFSFINDAYFGAYIVYSIQMKITWGGAFWSTRGPGPSCLLLSHDLARTRIRSPREPEWQWRRFPQGAPCFCCCRCRSRRRRRRRRRHCCRSVSQPVGFVWKLVGYLLWLHAMGFPQVTLFWGFESDPSYLLWILGPRIAISLNPDSDCILVDLVQDFSHCLTTAAVKAAVGLNRFSQASEVLIPFAPHPHRVPACPVKASPAPACAARKFKQS